MRDGAEDLEPQLQETRTGCTNLAELAREALSLTPPQDLLPPLSLAILVIPPCLLMTASLMHTATAMPVVNVFSFL